MPAVAKTPHNPENSARSSTLIKKAFQEVGEIDSAGEQLKIADLRSDFLEELKKRKKREVEQLQNGKRKTCEGFPNILGLINEPKSVYWLLEDLTYYHNKILSEANIAELFYFIEWVPVAAKTPHNPINSARSSTKIKKAFQEVGEVDVGEVREPDFQSIPILYEKKSVESHQDELSRRKHLRSLLNDAENANQPKKRSIKNDSTVPNHFDSMERSPKHKPEERPSLSPSNTDTSSRQSSSSTVNRSTASSFSDYGMELSMAR